MLAQILRGSFNEILIFDRQTLRVEQANQAARTQLQYSLKDLRKLTPLEILAEPGSPEEFAKAVKRLEVESNRGPVPFSALYQRKDGSTYPVDMRICLSSSGGGLRCIVIAHDLSDRRARDLTESNYRALISNIPGMAYQAIGDSKGRASLIFVSDYAGALLGIDARTLQNKPKLFQNLILAEDRPSYLEGLEKAGGRHMTFNWEGRIWIEDWKDVKWVNIRVKQRELAEGEIIWDGIVLNITQSKLAEAEILRSRKLISELAAHVEQVKEQERLRFSREVHDELGGNLTAIKIGLSRLRRNLAADQAKLDQRVDYLDSILDQTLEATHRIASNLRPTIVDCGLVSAVEWQVQQFCQNLDIECAFSSTQDQIPLDSDASIAVFRIVQEALTNISKHAKASKLRVTLQTMQHQLHLEISDNGIGPDRAVEGNKKSFGILGMKERAAALGGDLSLGVAPGGGTLVRLNIPLKPPKP
jgi:PAS domain S-box-containing protein